MKSLKKKVVLCVQLAGWLCLIPALFLLRLYNSSHSFFYLIFLAVVVLFAAYLLSTSTQDSWLSPAKLQTMCILTIIFVALLPSIPLFVAYRIVKKDQASGN
jgi:membrane-bound ClpP family serine protease